MAITREKRNTNFTMMSNTGLRDKRLSWKAKGLLAYMLSLPDDWVFYQTELEQHSTDKEASVRSGLKELEEAGYLVRQRTRNEKGHLTNTDWRVSDEPKLDNQVLGNQVLGNQGLQSTNGTKDLKELNTKKDKDIVELGSTTYPFKEIIDYLNEKTNSNYRPSVEKNKKLIRARINEGFTLDDFKTVIDKKTKEWKDDKAMCIYLRPETLFGTKFEGYLNQKGATDKQNETFDGNDGSQFGIVL